VLGQVVGWSVSIISVFVLFLLIYRVLPNAQQTWRDIVPGALLSAVLLLVVSQVFPIYTALFPPNHAYALFGVFLVFTFYLYILGFVFALGAELNAFLQQPARSVALAEATAAAERGQAAYDQETGRIRAETEGQAPALQGGGPLSPKRSPGQQLQEHAQAGQHTADGANSGERSDREPRVSLGGRIIGFAGLVLAALLLRGRQVKTTKEGAVARP
jgi:hypothetical protein